ncbi:hypothetical protein [Galbibacter orientalis]|uniref:hypothetical protein n=1 Tax=Galbibacter orientalis TaxID=453852 RepID=UPI0030022C00
MPFKLVRNKFRFSIVKLVILLCVLSVINSIYSFSKKYFHTEKYISTEVLVDTDGDGLTDDIDKDDDNDGIPDLMEDECEFSESYATPPPSVISDNSVTAIYSDFKGYWSSKTSSVNPTAFDGHSTLLAFESMGKTYATGVVNSRMIDIDNNGRYDGIDTDGDGVKDVNIEETTWVAVKPVTRITKGIRLEARALDGNLTNASGPLLTSGGIPFNPYLYEGERGLDMAYTIANIGNTWSFRLGGSTAAAYNDGVMDILLTQGAKLTAGSNYNRLNLLDANGDYLGNGLEIIWDNIPIVGESIVDQYNPDDSKHAANERKGLRFAAVELSEFNLTSAEISKAVAFRLEISSGADPVFFAVNESSFTPGCVSVDTDGDGIPNSLDLDSDNDGIFDAVEAGHGKSIDSEGKVIGAVGADGIPNSVQATGQFDSGNINYSIADSNEDNVFDYMSLDSDSDGCNDVIEAGFLDEDNDGILGNTPVSVNSLGIIIEQGGYTAPRDGDADGVFDFRKKSSQPTISFKLQNKTLFDGRASNITILADNVTNYRWQLSTDAGNSFVDLVDNDVYAGVNSKTLTIKKAEFSMEGYRYRVLLENTGYLCSPYNSSTEVTVKVRVKTVIMNRNRAYRVIK